jgi:hypothetical protein
MPQKKVEVAHQDSATTVGVPSSARRHSGPDHRDDDMHRGRQHDDPEPRPAPRRQRRSGPEDSEQPDHRGRRLTETGVLSELTASGTLRRGRSDRRHHLPDPVIVGGPWLAVAGVAALGARRLLRRAAR